MAVQYTNNNPINLRSIKRAREDAQHRTTEGPQFRQIRASDLQVDHSYQRPVSASHVNKIVRKFDPSLFGVVTVSERSDGSVFILDGQHRVAAIVAMGKGDTRIPCEVLTHLTIQEESEVFHLRNSNKKNMSPQEKFRGALMAGDERAVEISDAVRSAGFELNLDSSELHGGKIPAVAALWRLDSQYQDGHIDLTLRAVRDVWGTEMGPRGHLITGLGYFLYLYRDTLKYRRFVSQLSRFTLEQIYSEAKQFKQATGVEQQVAVASTILRRYNDRLREDNKLPSIEVMRSMNRAKGA